MFTPDLCLGFPVSLHPLLSKRKRRRRRRLLTFTRAASLLLGHSHFLNCFHQQVMKFFHLFFLLLKFCSCFVRWTWSVPVSFAGWHYLLVIGGDAIDNDISSLVCYPIVMQDHSSLFVINAVKLFISSSSVYSDWSSWSTLKNDWICIYLCYRWILFFLSLGFCHLRITYTAFMLTWCMNLEIMMIMSVDIRTLCWRIVLEFRNLRIGEWTLIDSI